MNLIVFLLRRATLHLEPREKSREGLSHEFKDIPEIIVTYFTNEM